jgi:hypothetical protein
LSFMSAQDSIGASKNMTRIIVTAVIRVFMAVFLPFGCWCLR